jgi:hypothetical protein
MKDAPEAARRSIFRRIDPYLRWFNGVMGLVVLVLAVVLAVNGAQRDPGYLVYLLVVALLLFWGISYIADACGYPRRRRQQQEIHARAKKYVAGQISLEEFGTQTKQILGDQK